LILNIFRYTFLVSKDFDDWKGILREVNEALLQGDYGKAFENEEFREGYALRWSPSRSLVYANVLAWMCDEWPDDPWVTHLLNHKSNARPSKVVCFGGGAAEVMAFAGLIRHLQPASAGKPSQSQSDEPDDPTTPQKQSSIVDLYLVDAADWSSVMTKLETGTTTPPILSKYASAAARASNAALLGPDSLSTSFHHADILDLSTEDLRKTVGSEPLMMTFFLTLNDLYTTSIPRTTALLRKLDTVAPKDGILLVIDSIGASSCPVTSREQLDQLLETTPSYPMDWLLDRVLMGKPQRSKEKDEDEEKEQKPRWEKIAEEKLKQHKLNEKLGYPGSLENMRFQLHAYRRV